MATPVMNLSSILWMMIKMCSCCLYCYEAAVQLRSSVQTAFRVSWETLSVYEENEDCMKSIICSSDLH